MTAFVFKKFMLNKDSSSVCSYQHLTVLLFDFKRAPVFVCDSVFDHVDVLKMVPLYVHACL